jgi:serine/threonine protein kinase
MGVVYKAKHLRLNRVVALKMILSGSQADEEEIQRFVTEAQALAALEHPNVVRVYDNGLHQGQPFCALEFVSGGSLADRLKEKPLSPHEARRILEQIAKGVQAAHDKGIVHRDLKPGNVLLASPGRESGGLIPKVTDFGLAKRVESDSGLTQTGAIMGTPAYMAPEQARGDNREVGPAADVWALGAMLYACLTGRPPFQAATPLETIRQVIDKEPVPVRQLQPDCPRDLETICHKCLSKEPRHRYASAAHLAEDLRRFGTGEPITARSVGSLERAWSWCRRNPVVAGLLTAVAGVLLLGAVASTTFGLVAKFEADQVAIARANAETKEAEAIANAKTRWSHCGGRLRRGQNPWRCQTVGREDGSAPSHAVADRHSLRHRQA